MKHIKVFESFKDSKLVKKLKEYGIENYTINDDGTIDVDGNVDLRCGLDDRRLSKIPFKFGKVTGNFWCSLNVLKTLDNCPYYVGGFFDCSDNLLENLKGSPEEVGGGFYCERNDLRTLDGLSLEIGEDFRCYHNLNLGYLDSISNIEGYIYCDKDVSILKFNGYCKGIRKFIDGRWVEKILNKTNESRKYKDEIKYEIETLLMRFNIKNYTIGDDGLVDVDGDVDLVGIDFSFNSDVLPIKFGRVSGDFYCVDCYLKSLVGSPYYVGGSFYCHNNKLKDLNGSPSEIIGDFYCAYNDLNNIENVTLEIGGNFNCIHNPNLKVLDSISNIEGNIICDKNVDVSKFLGYCKKIIKI